MGKEGFIYTNVVGERDLLQRLNSTPLKQKAGWFLNTHWVHKKGLQYVSRSLFNVIRPLGSYISTETRRQGPYRSWLLHFKVMALGALRKIFLSFGIFTSQRGRKGILIGIFLKENHLRKRRSRILARN